MTVAERAGRLQRNLPSEPFLIGSRPGGICLCNNASIICNILFEAAAACRTFCAHRGTTCEAGIVVAVRSFQPDLGHERDSATIS